MFAFIHPPILPAVGSLPNTYPCLPKVQNLVTSNRIYWSYCSEGAKYKVQGEEVSVWAKKE